MTHITPSNLWEIGGVDTLTAEDLEALNAGTRRVYELVRDGQWHTTGQIELAAGENGVPAREGMRRARELRRYGKLEKKRLEGKRQWVYRFLEGERG